MSNEKKANREFIFADIGTSSITTTAKTGWLISSSTGKHNLWDGSKIITDQALTNKAIELLSDKHADCIGLMQ